MKINKKILCSFINLLLLSSVIFSQEMLINDDFSSSANSEETKSLLSDALNAFSDEDWETSTFLLKKLHSNENNISPETLYMLIHAQSFNLQDKNAIADCDLFIKKFPSNEYLPLIIYNKGKLLFRTKDFEKSIITLSDFCNSYPTHLLYSHALFLIAENFYFSYNFDNAKPLYTRLIEEYPESPKVKEATYRLEILAQRDREEKLMYLLQQTGEEYLQSKESYEKNVKIQSVENSVDMNTQLNELRSKNEALDYDLAQEKKRNAELEALVNSFEQEYIQSIKLLKDQAKDALIKIESMSDGK